jgi:hypothetical protein
MNLNFKKLLTITFCIFIIASLCFVNLFQEVYADEGNSGSDTPTGFTEGGHEKAAIYISEGSRISENEYDNDEVVISVSENADGVDGSGIDGTLLTSKDYEATGIVVSNGEYDIGGDKEYYTVYSDIENDYDGTYVSDNSKGLIDIVCEKFNVYNSKKNNIGKFNTVLIFSLDDNVDASSVTTGSSGIDADNEAIVNIDNTYLQVDGSQRYVDSSYNSSTTIVNDSYFVSTGNASGYTDDIELPFSNEALLISGAARTNFSISETDTYYFNSTVIAEGWAALSTDSSTGDGLDLYAYNTIAKALNGGYSTYADFGCRVWLYGSKLEASEIGAIISKSGSVNVMDGKSATDDILEYNSGKEVKSGTVITGGRNTVMIHAPDMMGTGLDAADCGNLEVSDSTLKTSTKLVSTYDYSSYSNDVKSYVDYVSGDIILVKSTSADINLVNTKMSSYNGVILHSVLNSDSMGNFLDEGDNEEVKPISMNMSDMTAKGDILHEDYQRDMEINLEDTSLTGKITMSSYDDWCSVWEEYGVTDANWFPNETWDSENNLSVSLNNESIWTITDTCKLTSLEISEDAIVKAPKCKELVLKVNGEEVELESGNTYEGDIVISLSNKNKK